jgi:hypothetical protein
MPDQLMFVEPMTGIKPAYSAENRLGQGRRPGKPDNG